MSSPRSLVWRKSSHSGGQSGDCVELAFDDGQVLVRDSKNRDGEILSWPSGIFRAFTENLRDA
jgi:hypothetical protein